MTTAQVVETSVTVNNNSPIQDYVHPDDQTQPTFEMTPGFKPFTVWRVSLKYCLITTPMTGWVVRYFHITSYLTESSVNAIHEDTLRRISMTRFFHSSKYDRYYTHPVFYDFMCVCLFRFHVKHMNCILCSRRHEIKFLQSFRESAGRGIQCKQARVLEWTQWITLQKKERYVINASSQGRRL